MRGRRFWLVNGTLTVIAAVIAFFAISTIFHKASAHAAERTATATLGTVQQTVTASGNVSSGQSENLGFAASGTVTQINVSVGQQVTAGQVLAAIDPGPAQAALTAATDDLTAAQDNLTLAQSGGETPPQQQQDAWSLSSDQTAVTNAQSTVVADQAQLTSDRKACVASEATTTTTTPGVGGASGSSTTKSAATTTDPCTAATSDQQTLDQAEAAVTQAQNSLTQEQLSIATKRYVNPATILQDEAQVTMAQSTVTQDTKALANTSLTAPFAGTVTALNGAVGSTVSGGGSSAASSAGSSGSSGSGTGTGSSASSSSSSSSSAFMTMENLNALQVVAGFPESDAVKIKVGQSASVTMSALTGTTVSGSVTAISPTPTVVSNVVTYDVTVGLTDPPSDVQTGMSTSVAVVVASATNTLELPSSAVTTTGRFSTVNLLKNGRETSQPVTVGLVGDSTTQITSGLSQGDVVVEPSVTVSSGTSTSTRTGTGFGGIGGITGGGGGLFGGGAGGAVIRGG